MNRPNPYTVGAAPPARPPRSRLHLILLGMTNVFWSALMNALVRFCITVALLIKIWAHLPWMLAAYLTYVAITIEGIVFALKTALMRPKR